MVSYGKLWHVGDGGRLVLLLVDDVEEEVGMGVYVDDVELDGAWVVLEVDEEDDDEGERIT